MATIRWCPIFPKWDIYQPLVHNMSQKLISCPRLQRHMHIGQWQANGHRQPRLGAWETLAPPPRFTLAFLIAWGLAKIFFGGNMWRHIETLKPPASDCRKTGGRNSAGKIKCDPRTRHSCLIWLIVSSQLNQTAVQLECVIPVCICDTTSYGYVRAAAAQCIGRGPNRGFLAVVSSSHKTRPPPPSIPPVRWAIGIPQPPASRMLKGLHQAWREGL